MSESADDKVARTLAEFEAKMREQSDEPLLGTPRDCIAPAEEQMRSIIRQEMEGFGYDEDAIERAVLSVQGRVEGRAIKVRWRVPPDVALRLSAYQPNQG